MRKAVVVAGLLVACGGGGGSQTTTLDPNAPVVSLSAGQQEAFCDWVAQLYGGYGNSLTCDSGAMQTSSLSGPQDEADCVSQYMAAVSGRDAAFGACAATVGQVQTCLQWEAQSFCESSPSPAPAACTVVMSPQCSAG